MLNKKTAIILTAAILIIILIVITYRGNAKPIPATLKQPTPTSAPILPPTRTPKQVEIIRKMQTYEVIIKTGKFTPDVLRINKFDQVMWKNLDGQAHQIDGVLFSDKENFTKSYDKEGEYGYSCELHPAMKGIVIVR